MYSQSTKKHKALKIDSVEQFLFFSLSKAAHVNIYVSSRDADFQELYQSYSITNSTGVDFKTETCQWARYFLAAYLKCFLDCQFFIPVLTERFIKHSTCDLNRLCVLFAMFRAGLPRQYNPTDTRFIRANGDIRK